MARYRIIETVEYVVEANTVDEAYEMAVDGSLDENFDQVADREFLNETTGRYEYPNG